MDYSCYADQVIVITGGGGEIGGGTAKAMSKWGAKLALIDIHEGRLNEVLAKVAENGLPKSHIYSVVGDVMKQDVVTAFCAGAMEKFGKIDFLLNVVGTKRIKGLETCTMEDMDWCLDGNVKTTYMMCKACIPHLLESKGQIINLSSFSGARPMWEILPYSIAKAGVDIMTKCLCMEFASRGVRVNAIAPAALRSRFNVRFGDIFQTEEQLKKYYMMAGLSLPLARGYDNEVGTCETAVVPLIMFMGSDKAPFINGTVITVDGGYSNTVYTP